jgi:hypothetical protein
LRVRYRHKANNERGNTSTKQKFRHGVF